MIGAGLDDLAADGFTESQHLGQTLRILAALHADGEHVLFPRLQISRVPKQTLGETNQKLLARRQNRRVDLNFVRIIRVNISQN
ncbi:MAG: hypothetical protein PHS62_02560 [Patescibacteria group bacterium]|nr:hypothetical protein [Patescibacteria group bacterium]